ncbi:MAG: hypothetical protein K2M05_06860, partial [Paramuribaculum sp.]|nr:hypothetical protein [Paramuribaculum sp.]
IPEGEKKNDLICKIEKRNRIITIFVNNKFVYETEIRNTGDTGLAFFVALNSTKKGELLLKSIRVDQGPETQD